MEVQKAKFKSVALKRKAQEIEAGETVTSSMVDTIGVLSTCDDDDDGVGEDDDDDAQILDGGFEKAHNDTQAICNCRVKALDNLAKFGVYSNTLDKKYHLSWPLISVAPSDYYDIS